MYLTIQLAAFVGVFVVWTAPEVDAPGVELAFPVDAFLPELGDLSTKFNDD